MILRGKLMSEISVSKRYNVTSHDPQVGNKHYFKGVYCCQALSFSYADEQYNLLLVAVRAGNNRPIYKISIIKHNFDFVAV